MADLLAYGEDASVPWLDQETRWSCGPASLRAVLAGYDVHADEPTLSKLANCKPGHGTDEYDLVRAARKLGFQAWSNLWRSPESLRVCTRRGVPVICCVISWNIPGAFHWIVVMSVEDGEVLIMDPHPPRGETNERVLDRDEFAKRWWHVEGWWLFKRRVSHLGVVVAPRGVEF